MSLLPRRSLVRAALGAAALASAVASPARAQDEAEEPEAAAAAQPPEYRFELGFGAGYHVFEENHGLGRSEDDPVGISPANGLLAVGRLTLNFNNYVGIEGEGFLVPTETRDDRTRLWVFGGRGHLIVNFVDRGPFRPFILAGAGTMISIVDDESVVQGDQDGILYAGLGFKIFFGDRFGLRVDGRGLVPPSAFADLVAIGDESGYGGPDFEVLGSLFFAFDEKPRPQFKREVVVVNQPAPPPPPAPKNPDPDGDGIANESDKCPNVAEDKDGFEDEDGCPEPDNDVDGIPDLQDKCPLKAENKNGIEDDDGCPEEDTDGDGILGGRDKCPDQPETKNNFQDEDGCPDEVPVAVKKFTGVIEGINFKTKSADILPGSFVILDRAVEVLKEYPDVRLEISGHTDDRGSADFNRDLSQRRADAVKMYIANRGVAADRLQAVGYGEDRPLADNRSETGRARNRRTEFRLIAGAGQ